MENDEIALEVAQQPLVGEFERGFVSLEDQLKGNPGFQQSLLALKSKPYQGMRRIRGDGNCFFRAFMFSLVQQVVLNPAELDRITQIIKDSLDFLLQQGYDRMGVETFQEMMVDFFQLDCRQPDFNPEILFNNGLESEFIVWYARLLCAGYMKSKEADFLPFLPPGFSTVREYCDKEVEPQGKECEEFHIVALVTYLQVNVCIEYISASGNTTSRFGSLNPSPVCVTLLYRPGHYDLLV